MKGIEGERCLLCPNGDLVLLFGSGERCLLDCPEDSGWRIELRLCGDATLPFFLGGEGDLERRGDLETLLKGGDRLGGGVIDRGLLGGDLIGSLIGDLGRIGGGDRSLLSR